MATDGFDLEGYLARIGWQGALAPDLPTLRALVARHAAAIPFEASEALLGQAPALDPAALQAKMVTARRGGWCFEQNTLLALALHAIGFRTAPLLARVRLRVAPMVATPRTHMVLRVDLPEGPHLADVGFGGVTLAAPLALRAGEAQATPHGPFRLMEATDGLLVQALLAGEWTDLFLVGPEPQLPVDIEAANWLVANRPGGLFTANLVVSLAPPGRRLALLNRRLTIRTLDGAETVTWLKTPEALGAALHDRFGLALSQAALERIAAALAEARPGHVVGTA